MTSSKRPDPSPSLKASSDSGDFWAALRTGLLIGGAALVIALPAMYFWKRPAATTFPNQPPQVQVQPSGDAQPQAMRSTPQRHVKLADFGTEHPTDAVKQVANWSVYTGDHKDMAIVIVDKKDARVWVFNPQGKVLSSTPALLGAAVGDDSVPGIGEKPLSQVKPQEKTTPAGRFIAEPGVNSHGEDIVWVSYDLAVSLHRVRPTVKSERRLERLASASAADNRISFGCINLPPAFYEKILSPTVNKHGAVVYVLPETKTAGEVFGAYNVPPPTHVAQR